MSRFAPRSSSSLLKDGSWIKKADDEDEDVDRDPNFGKSVLKRTNSNTSGGSSSSEDAKTSTTISTSTSVQALSKRFVGSQENLSSSTSTTTITKGGITTETFSTTQSPRSPGIKSPTMSDAFSERVKSTSKGQTFAPYSPTRTTKVTETTVTSDKGAEDKLYDSLIPSSISSIKDVSSVDRNSTVTTTETVTVKSSITDYDAEDKLYDKLIPSSIRDDVSDTDSLSTVSSSDTMTVRSSTYGDGTKSTTTTTRNGSTAEDNLYDTLLPSGIKNSLSTPASDTSITRREVYTVESGRGGESPTLSSPSTTHRTSSYSSLYDTDITTTTRTSSYSVSSTPSDDYSSSKSYTSYTRPDNGYNDYGGSSNYSTSSYRSSSRSDDDPIYSKSSTNVYAGTERTVHEKDLCTVCRKPFDGDAKMVLDDMKINCHATCFKCNVCHDTLDNLKAGDSMWIYKSKVHCDNCFEITREKWRR